MPPGDQANVTDPTGPVSPPAASGSSGMAETGASSPSGGATPPGGSSGSQGVPPTGPPGGSPPPGASGGAPQNLKPIISSIAVSLATHPPGTFLTPPNVVNLASVAAPGEAWLTVEGENFMDGSVVRIDGRANTTVFEASSKSLAAQLTPAALPKPTEYRVTVANPPPGGVSNSWMLYAEPAPKWGLLEKVLVGGALLAAALWILWMIRAPLPGPLGDSAALQASATIPAQASGAADPDVEGDTAPIAEVPAAESEEAEQAADSEDDEALEPAGWQLTWFTILIILAVFTFGVGRALMGTWKSLLIDERNKQSLSRLQLVLWTGLVASAIAAAVAWNIHIRAADPLGIQIPQEILLLLGISGTALVGSNFIKQQQANPSPTVEEATERLNAMTFGAQTEDGQLAANVSSVQARWTDMFRSEGTGATFNKLDIGKIQLFFFTVVAVLAYAAAFARTAFHPPEASVEGVVASPLGRFEFPSVEGSLVGLLAISSFYYLANKAVKE